MKKPSSDFEIGLWVAGGLVAVYVLGFVLLLIDYDVTKTFWYDHLPRGLRDFLLIAYYPMAWLLDYFGYFK